MKKFFLILILIFLIPTQALAAADVVIDYFGYPGPIFNIQNAAPGQEYSRTVTFTNNYPEARTIGFRIKPGTSGKLKKVVALVIKTNPGETVKHNKLLADTYTYGEYWLDPLASGATVYYDFILKMNETAGNEYQGLSEAFDLSFGFVSQTVPPTTIPQGTEIISTIRTFGAQILTTTFPGPSAPTILSEEEQVTTTATSAGEVAAAKTEEGEVRGETDEKNDFCFWWFWALIGLAIVLVGYGYYLKKRKEPFIYWYVWPVILGILAIVAHHLLQGSLTPGWFCNWLWPLVGAELVIFYLIILRFPEDKHLADDKST